MLGDKWHEALPALGVPGVPRLHPETGQAPAHLHILGTIIIQETQLTIINTILENKFHLIVKLESKSKPLSL